MTIPHRAKPSWVPSEQQQQYIDFIVTWQRDAQVDDNELASFTMHRERGKPHDGSTWHKIRHGNYKGKDASHILVNFQEGMKKCVEFRAFVEAAPKDRYHVPKWYGAYRDLVKIAETREGLASEERLVSLVGGTGLGKNRGSEELIRELKRGVLIHARPSWKASYKSILWSLCDALHVEAKGTAAEMERVLIAELKQHRHTLYLLELSRFNISPKLVELLLLLLNETRVALVLAVNPEGYDHLLYIYDQRRKNRELSDGSGQFLRRGRALGIVAVDAEVATGIVEDLFPGNPANGGVAELLARAGTAWGGVSLVKEVAAQMHDAVTKRGATLTTEAAEKLVAFYQGRVVNPCKPVAGPLQRRRLAA